MPHKLIRTDMGEEVVLQEQRGEGRHLAFAQAGTGVPLS